jgi:O-antigen/teichoic acid export membrane protein
VQPIWHNSPTFEWTDNKSSPKVTPIFKEVKGLMVHQFSSIAVHATDNIIIASITGLGVVVVGLISNYNLIITSVLGFVSLLFTGATSSFGNLVASSTTEHYEKTFREINFLNVWIYGFCSIAFFILIPPFIQLWLGKEFLIDNYSFLLIVINQYMLGQATIYNNARVAKGNFNKDQWSSLLQGLINLLVSIVAARYLGLVGVYIGTVVSRLATTILRPYLTYKFLFNKSCVHYYKIYISYFVVVVLLGLFTYFVCHYVLMSVTLWTFLFAAIIVAILPNSLTLGLLKS